MHAVVGATHNTSENPTNSFAAKGSGSNGPHAYRHTATLVHERKRSSVQVWGNPQSHTICRYDQTIFIFDA